ncbi:MAG: T9SS type A sorting domain-containing protein [Saprospiraceae bacterium]|nr:proprotein convertase P-domain-containing protein [Bacteroidia bacterium]NNL93250.1 T9SS type A sorting domain-containing protein [Saprospiraceae bacterium]
MLKHLLRIWFFIFSIFCLTTCLLSQNCNLPVLSNISKPSTSGFSISWIDFNVESEYFEIEYGEKGFTRTQEANISDILNSSYDFTGLQSGTTYEIYIRTVCSLDDKSAWNGPYFYNTVIDNTNSCPISLSITDNNCPVNDLYLLEISDYPNKILGTNINLENVLISIAHSWPPDLKLTLISPSGKSALLSAHNGNGIDNYGSATDPCISTANFNDKACVSIDNFPPPFIGSFNAEEELSVAFEGETVNGIWQLAICDRADGDVGRLNNFQLNFSEETCQIPQDFILYDIDGTTVTFIWKHFDNCNNLTLTYNEINAPPEEVFIDVIECTKEIFIAKNLKPSTEYILSISTECFGAIESASLCDILFTTSCSDNSAFEYFDEAQVCFSNCDSICIIDGIWKNESNDNRQWALTNQSSNSEFTGPKGDKNNYGNYVFVESSLNCQISENASLISDCLSIESTSDCSVSFYYNMFGLEVASLKLQLSQDEKNWNTIWEQVGNQGDTWLFETVSIQNKLDFAQLRFVAEILPGSTAGDIALDHIKLYNANPIALNAYYFDNDLDGFGTKDSVAFFCSDLDIAGYSSNDLDCDDNNNMIHPNAQEVACNLIDENCNGAIDDFQSEDIFYQIINIQDEICKGQKNGEAEIVATNGNGPFTYLWSEGTSNSLLQNVESGIYYCTITASDGCQITTEPIIIGFEDILVYNVSSLESSSCKGADDGAISINIAGGVPPYEVIWSNGDVGEQVEALGIGEYRATITGSNGCQVVTNPIEVTGAQILTTGVVTKNDIDCFGERTGSIQLGILGGQSPYKIAWNTGDANSFISNLTAGNYSVTITDKNNCSRSIENIEISEPEILSAFVNNLDNVTCYGGTNGLIDININGGTPPYSYIWSHGAFSQDIFNLKAGQYSVTISDFNACNTVIDNIEITEPEMFSITLDSIKGVKCIGNNTGYIGIKTEGGTQPYIYNWSNSDGTNSSSPKIQDLLPGQYFVTIVDAFGCKSLPEKFEVVNENIPINMSLILDKELACFNDSTASIIVLSESNDFPLDYNWSAGAKHVKNTISDTLFNLISGNYNVTITDNSGCVGISDSLTINNPEEITYDLNEITQIQCFGEGNGAIDLNIQGGTGDLMVLWSNSESTEDIDMLSEGNYSCFINDENGCSIKTEEFTISNPPELILDAEIEHVNENENGSIILNIEGGVTPYNILWAPPFENNNSPEISDLAIGNYHVTITDFNGCEVDTFLTVTFISSNNSLGKQHITIFPNPINQNVIYFNTDGISDYKVNLKVYNLSGQVMLEKVHLLKDKLNLPLDLSNGIYILDLENASFRKQLKFAFFN